MMSNSKLEATFHPEAPYECDICEAHHTSPNAARSCCGDWLELSDN
jgi:hypothetical protein